MGIFAYFFAAKATVVAVASSDEVKPDPALDPSAAEPETLQTDTPAVVLSAGSEAPKSEPEAAASDPTSLPEPNQTNDAKRTEAEHPNPKVRRFNLSFRSLSFVSGSSKHKSTLSAEQDRAKKIRVNEARAHRLARPAFSASSTKRAKQSALLLRSLMVGPSGITPTPSKTTKAVSKPQLSKVKSQLLQPKSANKVIAQLRALPVGHGEMGGDDAQPRGPIHAVCLEYTEEEVDRRHFAQLAHGIGETGGPEQVTPAPASANIATASVSALTDLFRDMHLVNLINAPDLGLGQPPDGEGLLAGALPTAETVIKGIKEITPQLLALGFATGRIMVVDHTGGSDVNTSSYRCLILAQASVPRRTACPCLRVSQLYSHLAFKLRSSLQDWWGLELALPPPTLVYLAVSGHHIPISDSH
jgi:hypothetical protein